MAGTILYNQTFEASGSLPAGWSFDSGFAIDTSSQLSGANSLAVTATGAKTGLYGTQDAHTGNVVTAVRFKFASPGTSSAVHLVSRCNDSNPANFGTSSSYRAELTCGSAAAVWMVYRKTSGVDSPVFTGTGTFATALAAGTAYVANFTTNGGAAPTGTRTMVEIQRVSDGLWLSSAAAWQATRTAAISVVDTSAPLTGQGYSGVRANLASGCSLYMDEFTTTDFLDSATYTKLWTDDSGWSTGVGVATSSVFGSEAGIVFTGISANQTMVAAVNDQQWGNTDTYNTQFKIENFGSLFQFKCRNYAMRWNSGTNILLLDPVNATVVTGTFTSGNWTALRPYRVLAVGTATKIQFAVQDTVTSNWLQTSGAFSSAFAWFFDYTLANPAPPGHFLQFLCNCGTGLKFYVGAFTAGPAGTAAAVPSSVSVAAGATTTITPSQFDGVNTTYAITGTGGTYVPATGVYTAPGTAGSSTLTFTSQYHTAQTAASAITITSTTATTYTVTGPASGRTGVVSTNFTVTPDGASSATVTGTPSGGGLSTPFTVTFDGTAAAKTFTLTPTAAGTVTVVWTNSGTLTNPGNTTYTVADLLTACWVSSLGSDAISGGAIGAPFLTSAYAVSSTVSNGSRVVNLRGGDTFGRIDLTASTGGGTIQSYGTGQGILSNAGSALVVTNADAVTLSNVKFVNTTSTSSVILFNGTDATRRTAGVTVQDCDISGGSTGLKFQGLTSGTGGWNNVSVLRNTVYNSIGLGIYFSDSANVGTNSHFSNILIDQNVIHDIPGAAGLVGEGIALCNMDVSIGTGAATSIIKRNHIYQIGATAVDGAGPAGIQTQYGTGVLIQDNLIHDVYAPAGFDGVGLDSDVGSANCTWERNHVYNCGGAGYFLFSAGNGHVVRWNEFVNCGTTPFPNSTIGGLRLAGAGTATIHNNVFLMTSASTLSALAAIDSASCANKKIYNNTFLSKSGVATVDIPTINSTFLLEGNSYQAGDGSAIALRYNGTTYTSLAAFRTAIGRETGHGFTTTAPYVGYGSSLPAPTNPATMVATVGTYFDPLSPLVGAGLDLQTLYAISPGTSDFKGQTITVPYAVGAVSRIPASGNFPPIGFGLVGSVLVR